MTDPTADTSRFEHLLALADQGQTRAIEDAWLDLLADPPTDPELYRKLTQCFEISDELDSAHELFVLALEELKSREAWRPVQQIVSALAGAWPESSALHDLAAAALGARYAALPSVKAMLRSAKIGAGAPLDSALRRFGELLLMCPGEVYRHDSWGVGLITDLDLLTEKVTVDFPREKAKSLTFEGVRKFLRHVPLTHFLAQRAKDPARLRELGEREPVELIRLALQSAGGPIKQTEIKALLMPEIVSEARWTGWWNRARARLKLDPMIDFDAARGARATLALRDRPRTLAEDIDDLFFSPNATFSTRAAAIARLADSKLAADERLELGRSMHRGIVEAFAPTEPAAGARALAFAFLAEDLLAIENSLGAGSESVPTPSALLGEAEAFDLLAELEHAPHAERALKHLLDRHQGAGLERAAELLAQAPLALAKAIWKNFDLSRDADLAATSLQALLEIPLDNPETYAWAIKMLLDGKEPALSDHFSVSGLVLELISRLNQWKEMEEEPGAASHHAAAARQLSTKARTLLAARRYDPICAAVESMTLDQARRLRESIERSESLPPAFRSAALRRLVLTRPELDAASDSGAARKSEADHHLCTSKARAKKVGELRELTQVKIPANRDAIEEARAEGDLKENAGYHAAKDEQKILMQRVLSIQEGLMIARVVGAETVNPESISFGTVFEAENQTSGQVETRTILGRWEADPENDVISIQAPLARQFLGKKAGDEVVIERPGGGTIPYRVLSISNALASGDWEDDSLKPEHASD